MFWAFDPCVRTSSENAHWLFSINPYLSGIPKYSRTPMNSTCQEAALGVLQVGHGFSEIIFGLITWC